MKISQQGIFQINPQNMVQLWSQGVGAARVILAGSLYSPKATMLKRLRELNGFTNSINQEVEIFSDVFCGDLEDNSLEKFRHDVLGEIASSLHFITNHIERFGASEDFLATARREFCLNPSLHSLIQGIIDTKIADLTAKKMLFSVVDTCLNHENYFQDQESLNLARVVFNNLINNSIKYSRKISNLESFINISLSEEDEHLLVAIEDNGLGMEPEFVAMLGSAPQREYEDMPGSGIGWVTIRKKLAKLNWNYRVESEKMKGTKVSIYIPKSKLVSVSETSIVGCDTIPDNIVYGGMKAIYGYSKILPFQGYSLMKEGEKAVKVNSSGMNLILALMRGSSSFSLDVSASYIMNAITYADQIFYKLRKCPS